MKCKNCGNIIDNNSINCPICGSTNFDSTNQVNQNLTNNFNTPKKKKYIPLIIILSIIFIISLSTGIIISFNIGKKYQSIDTDSFITFMKNKNYEIIDMKSSYKNYEFVNYYLVARNGNKSIVYIISNEQDKLYNLFTKIKDNIKTYRRTLDDTITEINNKKINKYILNSSNKYANAIYIDNMIIYSIIDNKYKEEITNIFEELGYKTNTINEGKIYFLISIIVLIILIITIIKAIIDKKRIITI